MNKKAKERGRDKAEGAGDRGKGNVRCRDSHNRAGDGLAVHATFQPTRKGFGPYEAGSISGSNEREREREREREKNRDW